MSSQSDFNEFYEQAKRPIAESLEPARKRTLLAWYIIWPPAIIAAIFCFFGVPALTGNKFGMFAVLVPIALGNVFWLPIWKDYRSRYQKRLTAPLMQLYDPTLTYDPDGKVDLELFMASTLYANAQFSKQDYKGTDLVTGTLGKTAIRISDLRVIDPLPEKNKGEVIFSGVFFVADFNKNFSGVTHVLPRASGRETSANLVKLEDPDFERAFVVHSTDQIESRYILTPALMRRILDFQTESKIAVSIAFANSNIFIAMHDAKTRLEPILFISLLKPETVKGIWSNLDFMTGIVNELDLNTRIWTKQ